MATKITYTQQGDYLLPDLKLPEQPKVEIGIWGKQHLRYLKTHHPIIIYTNLLTSCKLTAYLADIDKQAEDMFFLLVNQLAEKEGVTEQLKADNQMLWVARMNNISNRVKEIVYQEIIYIETVKKVYVLLNEYFRYLYQQDIITKNPMANVEMLKKANFMSAQGKENLPPTESITVFSEEEIEKFKAEAFSVFGNGKRKYQQAAAYTIIIRTVLAPCRPWQI